MRRAWDLLIASLCLFSHCWIGFVSFSLYKYDSCFMQMSFIYYSGGRKPDTNPNSSVQPLKSAESKRGRTTWFRWNFSVKTPHESNHWGCVARAGGCSESCFTGVFLGQSVSQLFHKWLGWWSRENTYSAESCRAAGRGCSHLGGPTWCSTWS